MTTMIGLDASIIFENTKYKVSLVDNPCYEADPTLEPPQLYEVENKDTGVVELREIMLPKAISYADSSEKALRYLIDGERDAGLMVPGHLN